MDPSESIAIHTEEVERKPIIVRNRSEAYYRLPVEIHSIIVTYLDTESLIHYFTASTYQMSIAPHFASLYPGLFYPTTDPSALSSLIYAISNSFSKMQFASLNRRWSVVERIMASAKDIQLIHDGLAITRNLKIGCHRRTVELARLNSITTYNRMFRGDQYICGICFNYPDKAITVGESSGNCNFQSALEIKDIGFLVDAFGIRGLKLGLQPFFRIPNRPVCWEGVLRIKKSDTLQIITDVSCKLQELSTQI